MENFSEVAKAAWSTDDGKTTFAVPMASVIHGFFYNKAIFKELGLSVPGTEKEFLAVLEKIKANGKYIPLVMGPRTSGNRRPWVTRTSARLCGTVKRVARP